MGKSRRGPVTRTAPLAASKTPKTAAQVGSISEFHPSFSFRYADRVDHGTWAWPVEAELEALVDFLCDFSRLTWGEIWAQTTGGNNSRHRKHHAQAFDRVCPKAQERLRALGHESRFDELFRFRVGSRGRIWGFTRDELFFVLWWDADHQVYPTEPSPK